MSGREENSALRYIAGVGVVRVAASHSNASSYYPALRIHLLLLLLPLLLLPFYLYMNSVDSFGVLGNFKDILR